MKLDVAHDARVGVREGEIADIGAVLLREVVRRCGLAALSTGEGPLDDLAQLQVKGDHDHAVQPGPEASPLGLFFQLLGAELYIER